MNQDTHIILDKELRCDIDAIIQRLKQGADKNFTGIRAPDHSVRASRERSLAITRLQEAVMWLGMDLKAIHDENPQPQPLSPSDAETRKALELAQQMMHWQGWHDNKVIGDRDSLEARSTDAVDAALACLNTLNTADPNPNNTIIEPTADGLKL